MFQAGNVGNGFEHMHIYIDRRYVGFSYVDCECHYISLLCICIYILIYVYIYMYIYISYYFNTLWNGPPFLPCI